MMYKLGLAAYILVGLSVFPCAAAQEPPAAYLFAHMTGGSATVTLWVSPDLVTWSKHLEFDPDVYKSGGDN